MRPEEIMFVSDLLYRRSGLALSQDKEYLLSSRLLPVAQAHACRNVSALIDRLRARPPESLLAEVTEAMMTHESLFFRDVKPFEALRDTLLPQLRERRKEDRALRIWSAACASGQEPYSIAIMLLEEASAHPEWRYEIMATDLSERAVEKARQGIYTPFEIQRGMPDRLLHKYFYPQPDACWQAGESLRNCVQFRTHNVLNDPPFEPFDLIFFRNALIYFNEEAKRTAIGHLYTALKPSGFLILGSTEFLPCTEPRFARTEGMCSGMYQAVTRQGGTECQ